MIKSTFSLELTHDLEGMPKIKNPLMEELVTPILEECVVQLHQVSDHTGYLFPEELELVKKVSQARRNEFSTGRYVSRNLLTGMGVKESPILRDESGRPLWPHGVVGSISHKNMFCLVALSRSDRYRSLGTDIELVEPLNQGVWSVFTTEVELAELTSQGISKAEAINIVFSVKEALYKCAYPLFDESTPTFVEEKISYSCMDFGLLEAMCPYKSLIFRVIVSFGSKTVISISSV